MDCSKTYRKTHLDIQKNKKAFNFTPFTDHDSHPLTVIMGAQGMRKPL